MKQDISKEYICPMIEYMMGNIQSWHEEIAMDIDIDILTIFNICKNKLVATCHWLRSIKFIN
jgi:hypothetical protein